MAVVVGRMLAVLEAQTAQFDARMDAAGQQLQRFNSATSVARRSTALLKTGFQQLAFEGLGMMPPALARVSAGLLTLAGPGGLLLGAVAVLGVVSLAFERAGKKAQEFVEEANRAREFRLDHIKMLGGIGGERELTPAEQIAGLTAQRAEILNQIAARQPLADSLIEQLGGVDPVAKRAREEIDALNASLQNLDRTLQKLRGSESERLREGRLADIISRQNEAALARGGVFQALRPSFTTPAFGSSFAPGPAGPMTFESIRKNQPRFVPGDKVAAGFKMTPEFAVMSMMALMQGAQSGSASGFLGAAAAPVAMINPLAGMITSLAGGFVSLFERQHSEREREEERRKNELIAAIHEGPVRVGFTAVGDAEMSRYEMGRSERLGGEPRLGGL